MIAAPLVEAREEVGEEYYKMWRYEHGVPEGCSEIPKGAIADSTSEFSQSGRMEDCDHILKFWRRFDRSVVSSYGDRMREARYVVFRYRAIIAYVPM